MANSNIRQYVGARYVPKFADPVEWQANTSYEAMTIVTYNNSSYTSKIPVPATVGNPAENGKYWAITGNYNSQVEQYRQDVDSLKAGLIQKANSTLSGRRFLLIGDSYLQGARYISPTQYAYDILSWGYYLKTFFNLNDDTMQVLAVGGAGFVASTDQGTWLDRFNTMTIKNQNTITDVVICGGINDAYQRIAPNLIVDGMRNLFTAIKTRCPNAKIWVGYIGATLDLTYTQYSYNMFYYWSWCSQFGVVFMSGTETELYQLGMLQEDGTHPTNLGNLYVSLAIANNLLGCAYTERIIFSHPVDAHQILEIKHNSTTTIKNTTGYVKTLDTPLTGTFSGVTSNGAAFEYVDLSTIGLASRTSQINVISSAAYISSSDLVPCSLEIAAFNKKLYIYPVVVQDGRYFEGTVSTVLMPSFATDFNNMII